MINDMKYSRLGVRPNSQLGLLCVAVALLGTCMTMDGVAQDRRFVSNQRLTLGTDVKLSSSVRAGDVDGDGDLDLVVANGRHWPQFNMLFLNQSRGRFNVKRQLGTDGSTSYACELADLDGDGDLDVAVANDNAPCLILLNDGHGVFARHCKVGEPSSVRSLTVADIDGDKDLDLLFTCRGRPNRIFFNSGSANFDQSATFGTNDDSTIDVAVADLNKDGHSDLILANRDEQPNIILLATGAWLKKELLVRDSLSKESQAEEAVSLFQKPVTFGRAKQSTRAVATADFDEDGSIDWVVGNIGNQNTIYFGDGTGGVRDELSVGIEDGRTYCVTVSDMDNDGKPDIVVGNSRQANAVYFNRGGKKFTVQSFGGADSATYGLCTSDVTGDGFRDVVVANSGQLNRIYINQSVRKLSK